MNIDQTFCNFLIPKELIIHTSKHFYTFVPPMNVLPGRRLLTFRLHSLCQAQCVPPG